MKILSLIHKFRESSKELTKLQSITVCAMMLALRVVLGALANTGLTFLPYTKMSLNFLPVAIAAILYGPVCAMIVSGIGDILSYLIVPIGAYFPGWTLNAVLVGLLYGIFIYKTKRPLLNLIICEILIALIIEIPLGSLWMYITYDKAFWLMAGTRGLKTLIATPIEIAVVYFFSKILKRIPNLRR